MEPFARNVKKICKHYDCRSRTPKGYCLRRTCIVINERPMLIEYYRAFGRHSAPRIYLYDVEQGQLGKSLVEHVTKASRSTRLVQVNGWSRRIDKDMAGLIVQLNRRGIRTLACCSGHGRYKMTVVIHDKDGKVRELFSGQEIPRSRRFYLSDADGFYYIPEVEEGF